MTDERVRGALKPSTNNNRATCRLGGTRVQLPNFAKRRIQARLSFEAAGATEQIRPFSESARKEASKNGIVG